MREITTKVYTFDELPEDVQEKIIASWDNTNYEWWEFTYDDAERVGVKIEAFYTYRGTISIKCDYPYGAAQSILTEHGESCDTYKLAESFLAKIQPLLNKLARIENIEYHRGYRECLRVTQLNLEDEVGDLKKEFVYALGEEYLSILRQEYEYLSSRESILETIVSNGYEFTEEGKLV